jgi:hypothetical protein
VNGFLSISVVAYKACAATDEGTIDGLRNNRVAGNFIHSTHCGRGHLLVQELREYATQKPNQWWQRNYGADGNVIEGNAIASGPRRHGS